MSQYWCSNQCAPIWVLRVPSGSAEIILLRSLNSNATIADLPLIYRRSTDISVNIHVAGPAFAKSTTEFGMSIDSYFASSNSVHTAHMYWYVCIYK